jgi:hypothetical protein
MLRDYNSESVTDYSDQQKKPKKTPAEAGVAGDEAA